MKASITFEQLWFNPHILDFFFRKQARAHLEELVDRVGARKNPKEFDVLEDRIEDEYGGDLDLFEEDCYNVSVEDMLETLGYVDC